MSQSGWYATDNNSISSITNRERAHAPQDSVVSSNSIDDVTKIKEEFEAEIRELTEKVASACIITSKYAMSRRPMY
jgi:hypothetical protein